MLVNIEFLGQGPIPQKNKFLEYPNHLFALEEPLLFSDPFFEECRLGETMWAGCSAIAPLNVPELFASFSGDNPLCIFKTKTSRGTKLCRCFYFYSLDNMWKDQLYRMNRSEFYEWFVFETFENRGPFFESPENFSGPKSHLWNSDPPILLGWSFNMF